MARPPVATGEIPEGGAVELLREVELRSLTGTVEFEALDGGEEGRVAFVGGEIAVEQEAREDGRDPVDVLLGLGPARYQLHQRLPPLPVSKGDDWHKSGSLAVHVPADLMNYCERAGLTGVLELRHEDRRAEAIYRAGELVAIELDGEDTADLHEVFGWERGRFRIALDADAPDRLEVEPPEPAPAVEPAPAPPKKKREDTRQFLRVVEMALADVVHESERARSPTRTSPPLPPPPPARPRPPAIPAPGPKKKREQTVRLIYLSGDAPAAREPDTSTRHVRGGAGAELAITEAQPERRAIATEEPDAMAKKRKKKAPAKETPAKDVEPSSPAAAQASGASVTEETEKPPAPSTKPKETRSSSAASVPVAPTDERPVDPVMSGSWIGMVGWAFAMLGVGLVVLMFLSVLPPVSCPPGSENCGWGAGCIRTANDPQNCGACGNVCASGTCVFGECADES